MPDLAIIGGTGLTMLANLTITCQEDVHTPYGDPSGPVTHGSLRDHKVLFLARHGYRHTVPPHLINYRANLWALKESGATHIILSSPDPAQVRKVLPPTPELQREWLSYVLMVGMGAALYPQAIQRI